MTEQKPQVLLKHYLKKLKLPTMLREYEAGPFSIGLDEADSEGKSLVIWAPCERAVPQHDQRRVTSNNGHKRRLLPPPTEPDHP